MFSIKTEYSLKGSHVGGFSIRPTNHLTYVTTAVTIGMVFGVRVNDKTKESMRMKRVGGQC